MVVEVANDSSHKSGYKFFVMVGSDFMLIGIAIFCGFSYFMTFVSDSIVSGLGSEKKMKIIRIRGDEKKKME